MQKIWLNEYPPNVPEMIDPDAYDSLNAIIDEAISNYGDLPAFSFAGKQIQYSEYQQLAHSLSAYLQSHLGKKKGERIALMMPNLLAYPIAIYSCLRAGLIIVNVNPLYTANEVKHQLNDADVDTIIIVETSLLVLKETLPDTGIRNIITVGLTDFSSSIDANSQFKNKQIHNTIGFDEAVKTGERLSFKPVELCGDDLAFLQYTGGTTGISKGAMLTHRNVVSVVQQINAFLGANQIKKEEIYITALPIYHIFGLVGNVICCIYYGGINVLIPDPRDFAGFVEELRNWQFTYITGVNTLFNALLNTAGFNELDFSALRLSLSGGMPTQHVVAERWQEITGCVILDGYGLTETSPTLCLNPVNITKFTGLIGLPVPSTELAILDDEGDELAQGQIGEICARGPQVMKGYWNREEENRAVMTRDGFFRTGDIGMMDARGYFQILDRKKDMIIVSGFNIFPTELEEVLSSLPGIRECACIGIPDIKTGEAVLLYVVPQEGIELDEIDIRNWCKQQLAAYKHPRLIRFVSDLPKSNVGKILRRELRQAFLSDSL